VITFQSQLTCNLQYVCVYTDGTENKGQVVEGQGKSDAVLRGLFKLANYIPEKCQDSEPPSTFQREGRQTTTQAASNLPPLVFPSPIMCYFLKALLGKWARERFGLSVDSQNHAEGS
jgi:hypothetical protein